MPVIRLFTEDLASFRNVPYIPLLYPFVNQEQREFAELDWMSKVFDEYCISAKSLFQLTTIEESDFSLLPFDWRYTWENPKLVEVAKDLERKSKDYNKKMIVFFNWDPTEKILSDTTIVFRTSLLYSCKKRTEFSCPTFDQDILHDYWGGKIIVRKKRLKPTIGFCGYVAPISLVLKKYIKELVLNKTYITGHLLRTEILLHLKLCRAIKTNFITRSKFWAGKATPEGFDVAGMKSARLDFVNNMANSDYILCVKGSGNFSMRFFETLCSGRIPVFVNTDCGLPYDFVIDWKKYCVWVEESEIKDISTKILEFHERISENEFIELQYECRKIWEKWLSPNGFYNNFHLHFDNLV